MINIDFGEEWKRDCKQYHKKLLVGRFSHWCRSCGRLPIDETCDLWKQCECFTQKEIDQGFPDVLEPPE